MPLRHEDRMLVIKAIRKAIETGFEDINVKRSSLMIIAELVQEANELVAGHEYKLVMKGQYEFAGMLEDEIREALIAAGWRPPVDAKQLEAAAQDYYLGALTDDLSYAFEAGAKWVPPLSPETAAFGADYLIKPE